MPKVEIRRFPEVGALVKAVREGRGIRQEDLAEQLAFSRDYLINVEKGAGNLYIARLFRTLNELGITMSMEYEASDGDA